MSPGEDMEPGSDHRDLDPRLADASGAAAGQRPGAVPDRAVPGAGAPVWELPAGERPQGAERTYYGQPVVKAPPWGGMVSAYVVLGGAAGTAAALAAAAQVAGGPGLVPLVRTGRALAAVTGAAGAGLLMADLGRPGRALHMMRVVKPTSVMNVGGYLLSGTTGAAVASVVLGGRGGLAGRLAGAAGLAAGALGIPLSGYTGVLLGATAMPGWNIGIRTLPPLFMASGAATSASALRLLPVGPGGRRAAALLAAGAQAAELACEAWHERRMAGRPRVRAAYAAAPGWRIGRVLTALSLALSLLPARRPARWRVVAALLGLAGSVATKTAVFDAGMASARDPGAVSEGG